MNKRKCILLGLIILGSAGGVYSTSSILGVMIGGLLGGLAYFYIDWALCLSCWSYDAPG